MSQHSWMSDIKLSNNTQTYIPNNLEIFEEKQCNQSRGSVWHYNNRPGHSTFFVLKSHNSGTSGLSEKYRDHYSKIPNNLVKFWENWHRFVELACSMFKTDNLFHKTKSHNSWRTIVKIVWNIQTLRPPFLLIF